ncbi:MAG: hypothetical protein IPJ00_02845 [Saprospirales bacterium]|nr:hypothetical protein [Saprospirales bacterium]
MRRLLNIAIFALISFSATAQIEIKYDKGTVSFISSQNVYVKFGTTEAIKSGDTLYVARDGKMVPTLLVSNKSSISRVCTPLDVFDKLGSGQSYPPKRMVRAEVAKPQEEKPVELSKPLLPTGRGGRIEAAH